jgi:hypothetical protein
MAVHSILFAGEGIPGDIEESLEPVFFPDLNLDQIVASVTAGKDEYTLTPFFYSPMNELDAVSYRQEVFQDLERPAVYELVTAFERQTLVAKFASGPRRCRRTTAWTMGTIIGRAGSSTRSRSIVTRSPSWRRAWPR